MNVKQSISKMTGAIVADQFYFNHLSESQREWVTKNPVKAILLFCDLIRVHTDLPTFLKYWVMDNSEEYRKITAEAVELVFQNVFENKLSSEYNFCITTEVDNPAYAVINAAVDGKQRIVHRNNLFLEWFGKIKQSSYHPKRIASSDLWLSISGSKVYKVLGRFAETSLCLILDLIKNGEDKLSKDHLNVFFVRDYIEEVRIVCLKWEVSENAWSIFTVSLDASPLEKGARIFYCFGGQK